MHLSAFFSPYAAAALLPLMVSACLKVPPQSASLAAMEASEVTAGELQLRVFEAGRESSSIVESAPDAIVAGNNHPPLRGRALPRENTATPPLQEGPLRS